MPRGSTKPRTAVYYFGMRCAPSMGENDTWLEAEEFCYPNGGQTRRCRAINEETKKLVVVRCGIPDTYFSIPARGGYIHSKDGTFYFVPRKKERMSEPNDDGMKCPICHRMYCDHTAAERSAKDPKDPFSLMVTEKAEYVERFAITHKFVQGMRQLTFAQQGRNTYATREEAEEALEAFRGPEGLRKVLSEQEMATLEVRPVKCYPDHFDPVGIWFDD